MAVVTHGRAWLALLIALALAMLTGLYLPRSASASPSLATEGVTVYTDQVSWGDGTRTPDIAATSANDAVVAWREGTVPGKVDQGYIRYAYTTDGGANWSRPQTLAQETSEYAWQYVLLYHSGNEIFAYLGRTSASNSNGNPIDSIVVKHSTDEGHTWQEDNPTTFPALSNLILSGHPLHLPDKYVMPYWSSGRRNGVLFSTDLVHWTDGGHVSNGLDPDILAGENQLAVAQDDNPAAPNGSHHLVMIARSSGTHAVRATSSNDGQTWSTFAADPNLSSYNIARDYFTKDSNGTNLYIYNAGVNKDDREALEYKIQPVGQSWSAPASFANGLSNPDDPPAHGTTGAGWDTYPMADEYAPGKFFVVWEFDTTRIKVKTLDIP